MPTPAYKLHRRGAPDTSVAAAYSVDVSAKEQLVLDLIRSSGERGITYKEMCCARPDIPPTTLSARPKALEEKGFIYYRGDRRDGCRVMRAGPGQMRLL